MIINTKGLIIKEHIVGESDKYITLFTKDMGKIQVIAYSAKKSDKGLASATQLFTYGNFIMSVYKHTYKLMNVEVENSFYELRQDLKALTYAAYVGEFISEVTEEGISSEELLELCIRTLMTLQKGKLSCELIRRIFEIRALSIIGFMPELWKCTQCGSSLNDESHKIYYFVVSEGGLVCQECKQEPRQYIKLTYSTLYTLRYIACAKADKLFSFKVNDKIQYELDNLCDRYIHYYIDKKFKALDFIEKIKDMPF